MSTAPILLLSLWRTHFHPVGLVFVNSLSSLMVNFSVRGFAEGVVDETDEQLGKVKQLASDHLAANFQNKVKS